MADAEGGEDQSSDRAEEGVNQTMMLLIVKAFTGHLGHPLLERFGLGRGDGLDDSQNCLSVSSLLLEPAFQ